MSSHEDADEVDIATISIVIVNGATKIIGDVGQSPETDTGPQAIVREFMALWQAVANIEPKNIKALLDACKETKA
jgi:hypothetical protein